MNLTQEQIEKIIKGRTSNAAAANAVFKSAAVAGAVKAYREWLRDFRKQQDEDTKKAQQQISAIQAGCPHAIVEYFGDPAGGSDSFWECGICGKQSKLGLGASSG